MGECVNLMKKQMEPYRAGGRTPMIMHPDDASGVIIEAVWQRLRDDSAR